MRPYSYRTKIKGERGAIYEEVIVSYTPTVRNVAVRNASNIKQCRSSKNYNDNNNNKGGTLLSKIAPYLLLSIVTTWSTWNEEYGIDIKKN